MRESPSESLSLYSLPRSSFLATRPSCYENSFNGASDSSSSYSFGYSCPASERSTEESAEARSGDSTDCCLCLSICSAASLESILMYKLSSIKRLTSDTCLSLDEIPVSWSCVYCFDRGGPLDEYSVLVSINVVVWEIATTLGAGASATVAVTVTVAVAAVVGVRVLETTRVSFIWRDLRSRLVLLSSIGF